MAGTFEVTVTGTDALARRLLDLGADMPRVCARAVNRTLATIKTGAVRALAQEVGLRNKDVEPAIAIDKATFSKPIGLFRLTGKRIPLAVFHARQTKTGVAYRLPGGAGLVPSGFLSTMKSGHRGVFRRAEGQGPVNQRRQRGARKPAAAGVVMVGRLPIVERFGPSLPGAFIKAGLLEQMRGRADEALARNLEHEIAYAISRRAPQGDE